MSNVHVMDHPLIQHKIGIIRREETGSKDFRMMIGEIAMLMCYEDHRSLRGQAPAHHRPGISVITRILEKNAPR